MTYKKDTFEYDLIRIHEEDDNKHSLQWFLNDIFELKEKYCIDRNKIKQVTCKIIKNLHDIIDLQTAFIFKLNSTEYLTPAGEELFKKYFKEATKLFKKLKNDR